MPSNQSQPNCHPNLCGDEFLASLGSFCSVTSPNQALQRTAPAVTLAAPPPSPAQPSRQPPPSLSLRSSGFQPPFIRIHPKPTGAPHSAAVVLALVRRFPAYPHMKNQTILLPIGLGALLTASLFSYPRSETTVQ